MEPTLWEGEVVEVQARMPRVGDVIVFDAGGRWVGHRLVARLPGTHWGLQCGDGHHLGTWIDLRAVVEVVAEPHVFEEIPLEAQVAEVAGHLIWAAVHRVGRFWRKLYPLYPQPGLRASSPP